MEIRFKSRRAPVIHDFPYPRRGRKCPHASLISITNPGGCSYACPICYARAYPWSDPDTIVIYHDIPERLKAEIESSWLLFPFYLSQITDPLQPIDEVRALTLRIVQLLIDCGLSFRIVTRSSDGLRWLVRMIPDLASYPYFFVELTVESGNEKVVVTSPDAPPIPDRLDAIAQLTGLGIEVVARIDPIIIGLIDEEDLDSLIGAIGSTGASHIISSTGYFNHRSMKRLLMRMRECGYQDRIHRVVKAYRYHPGAKRRRFTTSLQFRKRFHRELRAKVEAKGMTYSVCQELPHEYDSPDLATCEGSRRNPVQIRIGERFEPLPCYGDCLCCPRPDDPPCGEPRLQQEYPYRTATLFRFRQPPLFGEDKN